MKAFIKALLLFIFSEGVQAACHQTESILDTKTMKSPGYPAYYAPHSCYYYSTKYIAPEGSTLSMTCEDFDIECSMFAGMSYLYNGKTRTCGTRFKPVTTKDNTLTVEFMAFWNYMSSFKMWWYEFKFQCTIQVNYPVTVPPPTTQCDCPTRKVDARQRIVGGVNADEKEFPYQVSIEKGKERCGGSLIANEWVITAAHCYVDQSWKVRMGLVIINKTSEHEVKANVETVFIHPDYDDNDYHYDIALIKLAKSVEFTDYISPVCLPDEFQTQSLAGEKGVVTGWGTLAEGGESPVHLQKATLDIISNSECKEAYGNLIFEETVCTLTPGKDTCKNDAGGPLVYNDEGRVFIIGVSSWGSGCARSDRPGVSTRVSSPNVLTWIRTITSLPCTGSHPPVPPPSTCECGTRKMSFQTRIVGGSKASPGEFPFQVSFHSYGFHYCGGSLISDQWILTAAHCDVDPYMDRVKLGEYQLNKVSSDERNMMISRVVNHELYNTTSSHFDIAVVKLMDKVTFTDRIMPICLPDGLVNQDLTGEIAETSGWGTLEYEGGTPQILQKVTLDIISKERCANAFPGMIFEENLCTLTPGKDACQGDSGGPLSYLKDTLMYQIGVTSWGIGCAWKDHPGVFTNLLHPDILDWVKKHTGITCTSP